MHESKGNICATSQKFLGHKTFMKSVTFDLQNIIKVFFTKMEQMINLETKLVETEKKKKNPNTVKTAWKIEPKNLMNTNTKQQPRISSDPMKLETPPQSHFNC